jgi:ferritin
VLSATIQDALNRQITREFASSYLYLAMAAWCETRNLRGFAHWLRVQSQEETTHGLKLFDLVVDRGGHVILDAITAPPADFESVLDVMQRALTHEQEVSANFQDIYALAARENDYTTQAALQWFLTEQVEEEKVTGAIVDQLKLIGSQGPALFLLDRELAARQPGNDPAAATGP